MNKIEDYKNKKKNKRIKRKIRMKSENVSFRFGFFY